MTKNDKLRIKVAELCGLKDIHYLDNTSWVYGYRNGQRGEEWQDDLPNYPNDLNAMHKAEKTMTDEQRTHYRVILTQNGVDDNFDPLCATAMQRAEAFVKTFNKKD